MPVIEPGQMWHSKRPVHISEAGDRVRTSQTNGLRRAGLGSQKGKRSIIRRGVGAVETNRSHSRCLSTEYCEYNNWLTDLRKSGHSVINRIFWYISITDGS